MPRRKTTVEIEQYPPLYMEALAYHESGHAVMTVLLFAEATTLILADGPLQHGDLLRHLGVPDD